MFADAVQLRTAPKSFLMSTQLSEQQMQKYIAVVNEVERLRVLSEQEKKDIVKRNLGKPYMDLLSDWAFKHILQNKEILLMLLNDFIPEEIDSVELLPNEVDRLRPDDKNIIMDVLCRTVDGREFICEMQQKKKQSFRKRMFYYGASMAHSQLKPKQAYSLLKPVYVICFMDFSLEHETDQLVYRYAIREQTSGEPYENLLSIIFCELPRLNKTSLEGLGPVESWFFILKNMRNFAGEPEDMGNRYAAIAKAAQMHNLPDAERIQYIRNMITEEERLDIGGAYYEDGLKDGAKKERNEIARKMLLEKIPLETIILCTGLSAEAIEALS